MDFPLHIEIQDGARLHSSPAMHEPVFGVPKLLRGCLLGMLAMAHAKCGQKAILAVCPCISNTITMAWRA